MTLAFIAIAFGLAVLVWSGQICRGFRLGGPAFRHAAAADRYGDRGFGTSAPEMVVSALGPRVTPASRWATPMVPTSPISRWYWA